MALKVLSELGRRMDEHGELPQSGREYSQVAHKSHTAEESRG